MAALAVSGLLNLSHGASTAEDLKVNSKSSRHGVQAVVKLHSSYLADVKVLPIHNSTALRVSFLRRVEGMRSSRTGFRSDGLQFLSASFTFHFLPSLPSLCWQKRTHASSLFRKPASNPIQSPQPSRQISIIPMATINNLPEPSEEEVSLPSRCFQQKYRPRRFDDLVGHKFVGKILKAHVERDVIKPAYLFSGPKGSGKTSAARIFAAAINCTHPHLGKPCGRCKQCRASARGTNPDIHEIDAASNSGVESIRNLLETLRYAPVSARYKVYIVDECHMLSKEAGNALLKTLEEPPPHVVFVLVTTDPQKLLEPVVSRCDWQKFRRISDVDAVGVMRKIAGKEKIDVEDDSLELIAQLADGSLRDAAKMLETVACLGVKVTVDIVEDLLGVVPAAQVTSVLADALAGDQDGAMCRQLESVLQDKEPWQVLMRLTQLLVDLLTGDARVRRPMGGRSGDEKARQFLVELSGTPAGRINMRRALLKLQEAELQVRQAPVPSLWLKSSLMQLPLFFSLTDVGPAAATTGQLPIASFQTPPLAPSALGNFLEPSQGSISGDSLVLVDVAAVELREGGVVREEVEEEEEGDQGAEQFEEKALVAEAELEELSEEGTIVEGRVDAAEKGEGDEEDKRVEVAAVEAIAVGSTAVESVPSALELLKEMPFFGEEVSEQRSGGETKEDLVRDLKSEALDLITVKAHKSLLHLKGAIRLVSEEEVVLEFPEGLLGKATKPKPIQSFTSAFSTVLNRPITVRIEASKVVPAKPSTNSRGPAGKTLPIRRSRARESSSTNQEPVEPSAAKQLVRKRSSVDTSPSRKAEEDNYHSNFSNESARQAWEEAGAAVEGEEAPLPQLPGGDEKGNKSVTKKAKADTSWSAEINSHKQQQSALKGTVKPRTASGNVEFQEAAGSSSDDDNVMIKIENVEGGERVGKKLRPSSPPSKEGAVSRKPTRSVRRVIDMLVSDFNAREVSDSFGKEVHLH